MRDAGNRSCPECFYYHHPDDDHKSSPRPETEPQDNSVTARINRALEKWHQLDPEWKEMVSRHQLPDSVTMS